jgi:hypothetical protein
MSRWTAATAVNHPSGGAAPLGPETVAGAVELKQITLIRRLELP